MTVYARRFILPALLLGGSIAAWLIGAELGSSDLAPTTSIPSIEPAAPLLSVRRLPEFATTSLADEAVAAALASLPSEPGGLSCVSVLVDGISVLAIRSDQPLVAAYAQLAITGHAAIGILGENYRYETRVMANDPADEAGTIRGGLFLVGGGDPLLMSENYSRRFAPTLTTRTSIETLAEAVRDAGVTNVEGGIVAIAGRYDTERTLPGWPVEYQDPAIVGLLGALQLDDGAGGNSDQDDPARIAADRFREILEDTDVQVFGGNRVGGEEDPLDDLLTIARISSAPLSEIVLQMMVVNDAGAAELLLKELAVAGGDVGNTQSGAKAVQEFLQAQGVQADVAFRDGSGIDPIGGTSCAQLVSVLDTIPDTHPTLMVLPSYDLPGVFDGQLREVDVSSDLRVVGGSQGGATGLVARTVDQGRRVTIASIVNRPDGLNTQDLAYQRSLIGIVDALRSSVGVDALVLGE